MGNCIPGVSPSHPRGVLRNSIPLFGGDPISSSYTHRLPPFHPNCPSTTGYPTLTLWGTQPNGIPNPTPTGYPTQTLCGTQPRPHGVPNPMRYPTPLPLGTQP